MGAKIGAYLKRSRRLLFAVVAVSVAAWLVYDWQCRTPTPDQVARDFAHALVRGDTGWMWSRATDDEKSIPGMSEDVLKAFHAEFIAPHFAQAKIESIESPFEDTVSLADRMVTVRTAAGKEVKFFVVGLVDEGKGYVGAMTGMVLLASELEFAEQEPNLRERVKMGRKKYGQWLRDRGVTKWFILQSWSLRDVPSAAK